jgi:hypothetical protein
VVRYISKKYTFAAASILAVIYIVHQAVLVDTSHQWMVIAGILAVTVICVTYLTGQAKIDLEFKSDIKPPTGL